MSILLITATGCACCAIAKKFMAEKGLDCDEHDAIGAGKERFGQFYRAHRSAIFRGKKGIEFPVLAQGGEIRQGLGERVVMDLKGPRAPCSQTAADDRLHSVEALSPGARVRYRTAARTHQVLTEIQAGSA